MWATGQAWAVLAGLRFMLAACVVCGHTFRIVHLDDGNLLMRIGGTSAALGFFVISGISIAHSIHTRPEGFARRRLMRIVPLYYASILFALLPIGLYGSSYFLSGGDIVILPSVKSIVELLFFMQGLSLACPGLMQHLWSMSCEVFYYCFTPWLQRRGTQTIRVLIIGSLFLYALCLCREHNSFNYDTALIAPIALGWAWLGGFLLYKEPHSPFAPLLIAAATLTIPYPAFAAAVIIILLANQVRLSARVERTFIYLGKLSYPLYLTHWTVFNIVGGASFAQAHPWYLVPTAWIGALGVAVLFYHCLDVPFRESGNAQGHSAARGKFFIPSAYFIAAFIAIALWHAPARLRILPLGDSITYGSTGIRSFFSGYRGLLEARMDKAGWPVMFVGTQTDPLDIRHEGHEGWRMDQLTKIIPQVLKQSQPDFILLQAGTNDLRDKASPAELESRIKNLLDALLSDPRHPFVLVASITPVCKGTLSPYVTLAIVEDLNSRVKTAVEERSHSSKYIKFVDMNHESHINCADLDDDGVHPNANGFTKMSAVWFNALAPLIK